MADADMPAYSKSGSRFALRQRMAIPILPVPRLWDDPIV